MPEGSRRVERSETARRQGRYRSGCIADEQAPRGRDPREDPADRDEASALLHELRAREVEARSDPRTELRECGRGIEGIGVAADAEVQLAPVVDDPADVAGGETRVEEAVERWGASRRDTREHLLGSDDRLPVRVEAELRRDARPPGYLLAPLRGAHPAGGDDESSV
ncbi:MAG: hypothetical protein LC732_02600 [Acidobacteria bacterium]|nr:hypothetical protein [Acidobacteriota bacterium]